MKHFIIFVLSVTLFSCVLEEESVERPTERTLFVYMPWSTDLTSYFERNVNDLESSLLARSGCRVVVFFSTSATEATLFEIGPSAQRRMIRTYKNPAFTTAEGIAAILEDVKAAAPAPNYSMVIGCHGKGWLPVSQARLFEEKPFEGALPTRFFGGQTANVQTDVTTLAAGIALAGIKMDYILFDDCYMSTVEVAWDLRGVADHLIASPTEVMAYGFPYHIMGRHLACDVDFERVVGGFHDFYSSYQYPYGTVAVTVCGELEALAAVMREINSRFAFDLARLDDLQRMDGYSPVIFFDLGDYVRTLCPDTALLARFEAALARAVPPRLNRHTPQFYSSLRGTIDIRTFSGITISDPSVNPSASTTKTRTAWWHATHVE